MVHHVNRSATRLDGAADRRVHPLLPPGYVLPRAGPLESDRQSVHCGALLASSLSRGGPIPETIPAYWPGEPGSGWASASVSGRATSIGFTGSLVTASWSVSPSPGGGCRTTLGQRGGDSLRWTLPSSGVSVPFAGLLTGPRRP